MPLPFILIDFENVQPAALGRLQPGATRVKVFLGQQQSKLTLDLVKALQPFGTDAEYIQISGSGPDAVDFHIAFYIGRLAAADPKASFTIVSKDKGFDPLVKHLNALGIDCRRLPDLPTQAALAKSATAATVATPTATPAPKPAAAKAPAKPKLSTPATPPKPAPAKAAPPSAAAPATTQARVKVVVDRLKKSTKPATLSKLRSTIKAGFMPNLDDNTIDAIVQSLTDTKKIAVVGTKVSYALG